MNKNDNKQQHNVAQEMADIELIIGKIMRIGVIIAAAVMLIGLIMLLITGNSGYYANSYPTTLTAIWHGLFLGRPFAYMMAGTFLLILTPVLRVIVSIYAFFVEKDMLYVVITTTVLLILVVSFIIGHN